MKVGVLTFHRCINYGSYWQARSLLEGLQARGHDPVLLDHRSGRVDLAEWSCAFRPLLPGAVHPADYPHYRSKIRKFLEALAGLPLSHRFSLDDASGLECYDAVVVGSDEVWNLSHPWYGGCGLFFGDGIEAGRLVSYAASFGSHTTRDGLEPWWSDRLRRFDAISVRDESSRGLIEAMLGVDPAVVLDPCLQFAGDGAAGGGSEEPFVAVYGHSFGERFARETRHWARRRGLPLVSVGYRNDWADEQLLDAGPEEFAGLLRRAEAVATNFFHGCVFALRHARPFATELSPYRSAKIRDLLSLLGEQWRSKTVDGALAEPVAGTVLRRIADLRRSADAYLDAALA